MEGGVTNCWSLAERWWDDGKGLEAHFSERRRREFKDDGFSGSVYILSKPLPNEKYISIRGRGLGRGSIKLSIVRTGRADDGKGQAITLVSAGEGSFTNGKKH